MSNCWTACLRLDVSRLDCFIGICYLHCCCCCCCCYFFQKHHDCKTTGTAWLVVALMVPWNRFGETARMKSVWQQASWHLHLASHAFPTVNLVTAWCVIRSPQTAQTRQIAPVTTSLSLSLSISFCTVGLDSPSLSRSALPQPYSRKC